MDFDAVPDQIGEEFDNVFNKGSYADGTKCFLDMDCESDNCERSICEPAEGLTTIVWLLFIIAPICFCFCCCAGI